jgi:hypothetical protein
MPDLLTLAVVALGVFLISFMRGAFGGGFAIIGIPQVALGWGVRLFVSTGADPNLINCGDRRPAK